MKNPDIFERTIFVGKDRVFYEEAGAGVGKEPLVFLHGLALCNPAFRSTVRALADRYHIIAPDLPGFGRSTQIDECWGYPQYAQFFKRFLDKLGIQRAHFVGHSMGGGISAAFAALYPKQVFSLVLLNSAGIPLPPLQKLALPRLFELFEEAFQASYRLKDATRWASYVFHAGKRLPFALKALDVPVRHDLRPLLRQIQAPCLLAWGERDQILPMSVAHEMASHIKTSRLLVVPDGYHDWSLLFPERVLDAVSQFHRQQEVQYC